MMQEATQFCVGLENKKGALARLCAALRNANVSIEALFVSDDDDGVWVNMVASPPEAADKALRNAGYHFVPEDVLVVETEARPGGIEQVASALAEAGVNIHYVYGSGAVGSPFSLVLSVDDRRRASEVLASARSAS